MKILVLMPLDEQHVYAANGIYKNLTPEIQNITFAMPMFMDYLIQIKVSKNWTYAVYDALISAKSYYKAADEKKEDLIIIGNIDSNVGEFDAVFNFQDIEEMLPYQDDFLDKIRTLPGIKDEPILFQPIAALHEAHESQLALMNCKATADFLCDYIKTDFKVHEGKIKPPFIDKYLVKCLEGNGDEKHDKRHSA